MIGWYIASLPLWIIGLLAFAGMIAVPMGYGRRPEESDAMLMLQTAMCFGLAAGPFALAAWMVTEKVCR